MTWVAAAVMGGSAILNYMGGQSAANQASSAANAANYQNQSQFNTTQQNMQPWLQSGGAAANQLAFLMGLPGYQNGASVPSTAKKTMQEILASLGTGGGFTDAIQRQIKAEQMYNDPSNWTTTQGGAPGGAPGQGFGSLTQNFDASKFQQDPGYLFRLQEGQKALERSGSARGMTLSGAQQKALLNYGQGMGSQEYQAAYGRYNNDQMNLFNRLSGIAGTGQQQSQYLGQLGAQNANTMGRNSMDAAGIGANATMNGYAGFMNAGNQFANMWQNQNAWNNANNNGSWGQVQWTPQGNPFSPIGSGPVPGHT